MNATEFGAIRARLKLTQPRLGLALGGYKERAIRHWESGSHKIPLAVAVLMQRMASDWQRTSP